MNHGKVLATVALLSLWSVSCSVAPRVVSAKQVGLTDTLQPGFTAVADGADSPVSPASASPEIETPSPTAAPTDTPTASPTPTPTPDPDAWKTLPAVPESVSDAARAIYATGRGLGNDPHAFSIIGDCLSLHNNLFTRYGRGPGHYNLGDYAYLQPVINWFTGSFNRYSVTLGNGFNTAAILSPLRADPKRCEKNETPLVCEYRIYKPSYVLIAIGTDDIRTTPATYESRMRQIVEYSIEKGVLPILATKADNREGHNNFNRIMGRLAEEYDLPLWNFWAAVQPLPQHGLADSAGHLTWADPTRLDAKYNLSFAIPVRNITALRTLDVVWRALTEP